MVIGSKGAIWNKKFGQRFGQQRGPKVVFKKVNIISLSSGILVRPMFHSNRQTNPEVKVGYD
jgi:hypothetical protein